MTPRPRPYQSEDVAAVIALHETARSVIGCKATGLGKAVEIAMLCQHYAPLGRVLVLVDVTELVRQLAKTIARFTGESPGIEMADSKACNGGFLMAKDRVIVSTVQTQYSGAEGDERYRQFDPMDFSAIMLDECLVGKTMVTMADGAVQMIADIVAAGSAVRVMSYNESTHTIESKWARGVKRKPATALCKVAVSGGAFIECTAEHPVYTKRGYIPASSLIVGDSTLLYSHKSQPRTIGLRDIAWRRLHAGPYWVAPPTAETSKVGDRSQREAGGVGYRQARGARWVRRIRAAYREEWRMGRTTTQIRDANTGRLRFRLQPVLSERPQDDHAGLAGQVGAGGYGVVVHGRRIASGCGSQHLNRGVQFCGAGNYLSLAGAAVEHNCHRESDEEGIVWAAIQEIGCQSILPVDRAVRDSVSDIQTLPVGGGDMPSVRQFVHPQKGRNDNLPERGLSAAGRIEAWSDELPSTPGYDSRWATVETITTRCANEYVYDLEVEDNHNFFANGILVHNCELFLAPKARSVVEYYRAGNPNLKIFGCSATTFRTDGVAMGGLFDAVGFDRDILWGIENGWLVHARQAFVRVSVDFSTLKVKKDANGDKDYSDEQIAEGIMDESTLVELAKGIRHVAGARRSIICCPNVESAKAVAHYLEAEEAGCARVIYGEMSDEAKADTLKAHKRGDFQFLSSVMMLTKGYDDPSVSAVFNCRKTRSKRLYQQILGRGTRPLAGLLDPMFDDPAENRIGAIASSDKPNMLMVNMVGVDDEIRDITIADILGAARPEVIERAKKNMLEVDGEQELDEALSEAEQQLAEEEAEAERARQARARKLQLEAEDRERRRRMRLQVDANVEVDYEDDLRVGGISGICGEIEARHANVLRKFKWPEQVIARMSPSMAKQESRRLIARNKSGLVTSWKVGQILRRNGYTREQVGAMTKQESSAIIERLKANGWRRLA